ncbi:MAG TPA: aminodeoxychorismate/anthranilate synthase component II [Capsulimonadaceae bacterium]|jgi:anthranilate synthase component 2
MQHVLVIDNYDSFTYNLVQYLGELGADVEIVRNDEITLAEIAAKAPDKIVISPGPCTPTEAGISVDVIREFGPKIPILGVCLGHQAIGAALGGKVVRAAELMHGKTSDITHTGEGVFHELASPMTATRYHSLIIERDTLPAELRVTAETVDGTIMAVKHASWPLQGVQFHPESVLTTDGKALLKNFLDGA